MSKSLNRVQLIGNLGSDPKVRSTTSGNRVATFSLATGRQWTDGNGKKQEKTEWHRVVAWGKLADIVESYLKKGDKCYADGSIEYRQWEDKEGAKRYSTEINVREIILLGSPNAGKEYPCAPTPKKVENFDDFPSALQDEDDDLPF